mgnify:CR=1 FL=1
MHVVAAILHYVESICDVLRPVFVYQLHPVLVAVNEAAVYPRLLQPIADWSLTLDSDVEQNRHSIFCGAFPHNNLVKIVYNYFEVLRSFYMLELFSITSDKFKGG